MKKRKPTAEINHTIVQLIQQKQIPENPQDPVQKKGYTKPKKEMANTERNEGEQPVPRYQPRNQPAHTANQIPENYNTSLNNWSFQRLASTEG